MRNSLYSDLRDAFDLFDRDKSGSISAAELKQVLMALNFNPTDQLLRKVMKQMDTDGSGSGREILLIYLLFNFNLYLVEFDEFVKVMSSVYEREFTDDEMRRAFRCFDADNSGRRKTLFGKNIYSVLLGYITVNELREVLNRLNHDVSDDRIMDVLREIDTDQDGKISYEEFVQMLQRA